MRETRHQQYLRILSNNGPDDTHSDRQACKYLKDMGYAGCELRLSHSKANYGEVLDVVWCGVTSRGLDYIDELRAQLADDGNTVVGEPHSQAQHRNDSPATQSMMAAHAPVQSKLWHERSTFRVIVVGVLITVLGGLILWALTS